MNLDQLIAFERIVREGSFSRAAWYLQIPQPTISARIKSLEGEVGGELFTRGRTITLTERGRSFLPYARQALMALTEGKEAAQLVSNGGSGRLTIGALRSQTGPLLSSALFEFRKTYPDVECSIREGTHWQMMDLLYEGVVELALIAWPCVDPLIAEVTPLLGMREEILLMCGRGHPFAKRERLTRANVVAESDPFLLCRVWQIVPPVIGALATEATRLVDVAMDTGRYFLQHNTGAGYFPPLTYAHEIAAGEIVTLTAEGIEPVYRESALVCLQRNRELSAAARNFQRSLAARAAVLEVGRPLGGQ
mgnify:CR=1 FL=1